MIGSRDEARRHEMLQHPGRFMKVIRELDRETSEAVRAIWLQERSKRVATFGKFAQ
jgi:hypothetical protein